MYSKKRSNHLMHLKQIFERCRKYGISLNPKKTIFVVIEDKLLIFIMSKYGMVIEPKIIEFIANITHPCSKKMIQSFLGKINFIRRFVPSFVEIVKPLQDMKRTLILNWSLKKKKISPKLKNPSCSDPKIFS